MSMEPIDTCKRDMCAVLKDAIRVGVFSHVSPDGDTLGSMLGIGLALKKMGKEVFFFNWDPIPDNLLFLPGAEKIKNSLPEKWPDVLLFVDCADLQRVNLQTEDLPQTSTVLNLDHHVSNVRFAHYNWVDPQASATAELAYHLILGLETEIDEEIATNLYTGIITDTGSFQYSNTHPCTHRIAADLLEKGIDVVRVHHLIYNQHPLAQLRLLSRALEGLQLLENGKLAVMTLNSQDFTNCGAKQEMSEGLINYAKSVAGVEVAVLLKEAAQDVVKVSLRSNLWLDVNKIALKFGGGGHYRAAGCTIHDSLSAARNHLIQAIEVELKNDQRHN